MDIKKEKNITKTEGIRHTSNSFIIRLITWRENMRRYIIVLLK